MDPVPTVLFTPPRLAENVVMFHHLDSYASDQYRVLAHTVEKARNKKEFQTLAITSALENEGKTLTSLNLAYALTETRPEKVVLCDLDLRKGSLAEVLGFENLPGLTDVLNQKKPISDTLLKISKNLAILPSGKPTAHPVSLFRSVAWKPLLENLVKYFDYVLFDMPPLCLTEDMALLDDVVEKIAVVVRAGSTTREAVEDGLSRIDQEKMLGFILNDADPLESSYGRYFSQNHYKSRYPKLPS